MAKTRRETLARPAPNSVVGSSFRAAGNALQPRKMKTGSGSYRGSLTKANRAIGDSFGAAGRIALGAASKRSKAAAAKRSSTLRKRRK